ncbi:MAG: ATP synthase F1 subunit delta [Bacteroidetes bacterium]|nr:ATP synthase F1 subunit delta [Bacteroidota bacterium]
MPNPRLAGRYAKSLMDLAIEKGQLDTVYKDMLLLNDLCNNNRELVTVLKSPVIKPEKKEKILDAITKDKVSVITTSFNKLLTQKGREFYLPEIITAFIQQFKDYKGIYIVKLTTAMPVSEELKNTIVKKIQADTQMKQVELVTEVKEDIIGGFILEVGNEIVDASVAFDLNNVRKQFANNDFIYRIR